MNTWLTDTPEVNETEYFYTAFPYSVNGQVNLDKHNRFDSVLYGFIIDNTDSHPYSRVTYIADNENFTPAYMDYTKDVFNYGSWENAFFMPRVVMLNQNGTVAYEIDPNDYSLKKDGTPSDYNNADYPGNVMIEFPQVWIKTYQTGTKQYCYISNKQIDNTYHCYTHYDAANTLKDYIYVAAYDACNVNEIGRSIATSGKPVNTQNTTKEVSLATANGNGWYTGTIADRQMINMLLILMGKSTNTQEVFGQGYTDGGSSAGSLREPGQLTKKGLFYGTNTNAPVKVFGIENLWGNIWKRIAGWIMVNGQQKIKLTRGTIDGSTATDYNQTGDGYIQIGLTPSGTSGGYISSSTMNEYGLYPQVVSGSSTTYSCDGLWFNNSITAYARVGGPCVDGALCGALCSHLDNTPSHSYWHFGFALSYR